MWHLWNTPTLYDDIANELHRFTGVHVCDVREPTRGFADRVLPGDGIADVPRILRALDDAGWDGLYDIEIFSDNGTFGADVPGLDLGRRRPAEALARAARGIPTQCWSLTPQTVKESR